MLLRQLSKWTAMLEGLVPQAYCIHVPRLCHRDSVDATRKNDSVGHRDQLSLCFDNLPANQIISALQNKKDVIRGSHIVSALHSLSKRSHLVKYGREKNVMKELIPILIHHKSKLSGQETVDVVKMLEQIGITKSSKIYSEMLQQILECVDDLSLKNLSEVCDISLDKTIDDSLRHALKAALKQEFAMRFSIDSDRNDIEIFQYALHFLSRTSDFPKDHALLHTLLRTISNCNDPIPLDSGVSIYKSLHYLEYSQLTSDALQKVQTDLTNQAHLLTKDQIRDIVYAIQNNQRRSSLSCDEKFVNALARRVIDGKFDFGFSILILSWLNRARYKSPELLNHCCTVVSHKLAEHDRRPQKQMKIIQLLLHELAVAKYRPVFWDQIQDSISKFATDYYRDSESLVRLAADLVTLDWLSNPILAKIFDGSYKPSNLSNVNRVFCSIYQRLKLDTSYNGPLPTDSQIAALGFMFRQSHRAGLNRQFPFAIHLREGMKDLACILLDVKTRHFHELDYVVAVHQDGTPAPIIEKKSPDGIRYIEDLRVPPGAKLVIIHLLLRSWFYTNTMELLGQFQTIVKGVELLPYPVVFINEFTWYSLPPDEKTSFLMDALKAKLDSAH